MMFEVKDTVEKKRKSSFRVSSSFYRVVEEGRKLVSHDYRWMTRGRCCCFEKFSFLCSLKASDKCKFSVQFSPSFSCLHSCNIQVWKVVRSKAQPRTVRECSSSFSVSSLEFEWFVLLRLFEEDTQHFYPKKFCPTNCVSKQTSSCPSDYTHSLPLFVLWCLLVFDSSRHYKERRGIKRKNLSFRERDSFRSLSGWRRWWSSSGMMEQDTEVNKYTTGRRAHQRSWNYLSPETQLKPRILQNKIRRNNIQSVIDDNS